MSFKAYINNIQEKTGKTPDDFKKMAGEKGFFRGRKTKSENESNRDNQLAEGRIWSGARSCHGNLCNFQGKNGITCNRADVISGVWSSNSQVRSGLCVLHFPEIP